MNQHLRYALNISLIKEAIMSKKTKLPDFSKDPKWIQLRSKMGIEISDEEKKILARFLSKK